jgi:hypothetical protein
MGARPVDAGSQHRELRVPERRVDEGVQHRLGRPNGRSRAVVSAVGQPSRAARVRRWRLSGSLVVRRAASR